MEKGTSLKLVNCRTTNDTTILSADLGKVKYSLGSFIKMDYETTLSIDDFIFSGSLTSSFITFSHGTSVNIAKL